MQSFLIVNVFDEERDSLHDVNEVLIFPEIHLLFLECFDEGFGKGIMIRAPACGHADTHLPGQQEFNVLLACILGTTVGVMDQSRRRVAQRQRHFQRTQAQPVVDGLGESPADDPSREDMSSFHNRFLSASNSLRFRAGQIT